MSDYENFAIREIVLVNISPIDAEPIWARGTVIDVFETRAAIRLHTPVVFLEETIFYWESFFQKLFWTKPKQETRKSVRYYDSGAWGLSFVQKNKPLVYFLQKDHIGSIKHFVAEAKCELTENYSEADIVFFSEIYQVQNFSDKNGNFFHEDKKYIAITLNGFKNIVLPGNVHVLKMGRTEYQEGDLLRLMMVLVETFKNK